MRTIDADEIPLDDLLHLANEAPVVRLVNLLLIEALDARASDVHLEGYEDGLRVRYRVDGVLQNAPSPPPHLTAAIISRLKIMAELDIAERRLPQDGRIRLRLQNRQVDVRVSTVPTLRGESVVLRLLDKERGRISLLELGMAADTLELFTEVVSRPHGIVLVTGPTGSGKTTTLYAAVEMIRTGREKILTVEDPVEYELAGVPQVPVNEKVGMTFAGALRALLRQDPDIILVGEIRDAETAQIATQAALTGHLVLSTLHTNDAPTALTRLLDLDVAAYLVASTVDAVLAQRLVRVICPHCKTETRPDKAAARRIDVEASRSDARLEGRGMRRVSRHRIPRSHGRVRAARHGQRAATRGAAPPRFRGAAHDGDRQRACGRCSTTAFVSRGKASRRSTRCCAWRADSSRPRRVRWRRAPCQRVVRTMAREGIVPLFGRARTDRFFQWRLHSGKSADRAHTRCCSRDCSSARSCWRHSSRTRRTMRPGRTALRLSARSTTTPRLRRGSSWPE